MEGEDWIKKIFDEKRAQNDAADLEVAVEAPDGDGPYRQPHPEDRCGQ